MPDFDLLISRAVSEYMTKSEAKTGEEKESTSPHGTYNLLTLDCVPDRTWQILPTARKIAKIGIFWYEFAQKGYTPLSDFYKIWLGQMSPRSAPSYQISPF